MRPRRAHVIAALVAGVSAGTSAVASAGADATRVDPTAHASAIGAFRPGGPIANVCSLLNEQEIDAALGGRYIPVGGLDGWAASYGQRSTQEANPLYKVDHAYRELALANCAWTTGQPASGKSNLLNYVIGVYAVPVNPALMLEADAKAAVTYANTIHYAPLSNIGCWAGFAHVTGTAVLRVVVGHDVVTILTSYSLAARSECIQLAKTIAKRLH